MADMKHDVDCWTNAVVKPEIVDLAETLLDKRDVILNGAKKTTEDLLVLLAKEKIETEAPGEFYVTVGYRSRPKSY